MLADAPSWIWFARSVQSTVAEIFGVHRSTICRDFAEFRRPVLRIFRGRFAKILRFAMGRKEWETFSGRKDAQANSSDEEGKRWADLPVS